MTDQGATVVAISDPDLAGFRADHGIPSEAATCHSALVEGYVIQGHVPAQAVERLITDEPDAVGIVVLGMPADSPGMGGDPVAWANQEVLLIGHDGSMTPFDF